MVNKTTLSYTIQEIATAWFEFTKPMFRIDTKIIDPEDLEPGSIVHTQDVNSVEQMEIDYSRWIPYLISEKWRTNK